MDRDGSGPSVLGTQNVGGVNCLIRPIRVPVEFWRAVRAEFDGMRSWGVSTTWAARVSRIHPLTGDVSATFDLLRLLETTLPLSKKRLASTPLHATSGARGTPCAAGNIFPFLTSCHRAHPTPLSPNALWSGPAPACAFNWLGRTRDIPTRGTPADAPIITLCVRRP